MVWTGRHVWVGTVLVVLSGMLAGCARQHVVCFSPNTEPAGARIMLVDSEGATRLSVTDKIIEPSIINEYMPTMKLQQEELVSTAAAHPGTIDVYEWPLTETDIQKGEVWIPEMYFIKEGYLPYRYARSKCQLKSSFQTARHWYHWYHNAQKAHLVKDPDYCGKNTIRLTVNSEPQGARLYENGKLIGTTPITLRYSIEKRHYEFGAMNCVPLVAVHDTCLPGRQGLELKIDPEWRYESGCTHEYATLFLLNRDPNYKPPVVVKQQSPGDGSYDINIKKEKDMLDVLEQAGQIGIIMKSLRPVR